MNFSKKIFAFFYALSLCCFFSFSQEDASSQPQNEKTQNSQNSPLQIPGEDTLTFDGADDFSGEAQTQSQMQKAPSAVWIFFKMIFVLVFVIVCIYFAATFMRKKFTGEIKDDDMFLRKVAALSISPGKSVQIVTLLERAYLLGVTENSIDLISEIADKELVDAMNLNADRNESKARARNFSDILSIFLNSKNAKKKSGGGGENAYENSSANASSIEDFFNAQRKKINGE